MSNNVQDPKNDNNGNNGFVWSQRLTVVSGIVIAVALAAARFAPVLASAIRWQP